MMLNGFTQTLNDPERNSGTSMGQGLTLISKYPLLLALLKHVNPMVPISTGVMSEDYR